MTSEIPKRAMVLAAGYGKRMRPLSATAPKPLIEVAGKALIDHCLDGLAAANVETAIVNVHYLPSLIEARLARRNKPQIIISDERKQLLDTGGGIVKALPDLGADPFFVRNSDSFWIEGVKSNLDLLGQTWDDQSMDGLMLMASSVESAGYNGPGDFQLDPIGRISRRKERTVAPFVNAGAAIFHPRLFKDVPDGPFSMNILYDRAIEEGRLFGLLMDGTWLNVETPESVKIAENAIMESAA